MPFFKGKKDHVRQNDLQSKACVDLCSELSRLLFIRSASKRGTRLSSYGIGSLHPHMQEKE